MNDRHPRPTPSGRELPALVTGLRTALFAALLLAGTGSVSAQCGTVMALGGMMVSADYHINIPNNQPFAFEIVARSARCTVNGSFTASSPMGTDTDLCHNWQSFVRPAVGLDQSMSAGGGSTRLGANPECSVRFFNNLACSGSPVTVCFYADTDGLPVELMSFSVEPEAEE